MVVSRGRLHLGLGHGTGAFMQVSNPLLMLQFIPVTWAAVLLCHVFNALQLLKGRRGCSILVIV